MHDDIEAGTLAESFRSRRSRWTIAILMLVAIGAFYLLREHWSHAVGIWPYFLLLACPLMHLMHGARHRHGANGRSGKASR